MIPGGFLVSTLTPLIVASIGLVFSVRARPADAIVEVDFPATSDLIIVVDRIIRASTTSKFKFQVMA